MQKTRISATYGKMGGNLQELTLRPHACTMCVQGDKTTRRAISRFMASRYIAKIYITAISTKVTDPFTAPGARARVICNEGERQSLQTSFLCHVYHLI